MKTPLLCSILFLLMTAMGQAQDLSPQPKFAPQKIVDQSAASNPINSSLNFYNADETDKSCAYLRVYRVRRRYGNSDMTVPSGYTVCVPSWKTNLRSAVQTRTVPVIGEIGK